MRNIILFVQKINPVVTFTTLLMFYSLVNTDFVVGQVGNVAFISTINGKQSACQVRIAGSSILQPLLPYQPLSLGDEIIINGLHESALVSYGNGTTISISKQQSPYKIIKTGPDFDQVFANFISFIKDNLVRLNNRLAHTGPPRGSGTFGPIDLRGLEDQTAMISKSHGWFGIGWRNGQEPFEVILKDSAGIVIFSKDNVVNQNMFAELERPLEEGTYAITLVDSLENTVVGGFQVVDMSPIMQEINSKIPQWLPKEAIAIFQTKHLLERDRYDLAYEAYLRLAPYRNKSRDVDLLMRGLELGLAPLVD